MTAAAIEDALLAGLGSNARSTTPADTAGFPGLAGDGRGIYINQINAQGLQLDVKDAGITGDVCALLDISPPPSPASVPTVSEWGLIGLTVLLLIVGIVVMPGW